MTSTPLPTPLVAFEESRQPLPVDTAPVATADLDGDGRLDLVLGGSQQPRVVLLFGVVGGFSDPVQIRVDSAVAGLADLAIADVTGLGPLDIVASDPAGQRVVTLLGDGHGGIGDVASTSLAEAPGRILVHEITGDHSPDLIAAVANAVLVLPGLRDGAFDDGLAARLTTPARPVDLLLFDVDHDGRLDVLAANDDEVSIFLNQGGGAFASTTPLSAGTPTALASGDFNGDGRLDVAVADSAAGEILVFPGTASGLGRAPLVAASAANVARLFRTDANGDGRADIVALDSAGGLARTLLGDGRGRLTLAADAGVGGDAGGLGVADFSGDRLPDLALTATGDAAVVLGTNVSPVTVLPGDVNQDGVVNDADLPVLAAEIFDGDLPDADSCAAGTMASNANADGNGDGAVTAADFTSAVSRFGNRQPD